MLVLLTLLLLLYNSTVCFVQWKNKQATWGRGGMRLYTQLTLLNTSSFSRYVRVVWNSLTNSLWESTSDTSFFTTSESPLRSRSLPYIHTAIHTYIQCTHTHTHTQTHIHTCMWMQGTYIHMYMYIEATKEIWPTDALWLTNQWSLTEYKTSCFLTLILFVS